MKDMNLVNMPKVRVKAYPKGWVVEREFKTWYGRRYWKPIICVSGIKSEPWHYQTLNKAIEEAKKCFGWDLYMESDI